MHNSAGNCSHTIKLPFFPGHYLPISNRNQTGIAIKTGYNIKIFKEKKNTPCIFSINDKFNNKLFEAVFS